MKMLFRSFLVCVALLFAPVFAISQVKNGVQSSAAGEELLHKAAEYIFDSRCVKFNARVEIKGEKYLNSGLFYGNRERGYLSLKGSYEYEHDSSAISLMNIATNECTIQRRNRNSEDVGDNPFALLQGGTSQMVAEPVVAILNGKRVKCVIVTPKRKSSYRSAKIYISEGKQPKLIKIELLGNNEYKYDITVTEISERLSANQAAKYKLDLNKYKRVQINDLR